MTDRHVTLICDASAMREGGHGTDIWGWAGMAISDRGRKLYGLPGKVHIRSSTEAEVFAIVGTILAMVSDSQKNYSSVWEPGWGWLIQSDCQHAVNLINFHFEDKSHLSRPIRPPVTTPNEDSAIAMLAWTVAFLGKSAPAFIYVKHVKGHLTRDDPRFDKRHHVQADVDDHAGKMSRLAYKRSKADA